jgi:2-octaprenylphenol hydroxylase
VRLIEPRTMPQWSADDVDLRVYALSRASQHILAAAGVWETIAARRASPYRRMVVWEDHLDTHAGTLHFDSAELGEPDLGHIVEDCLIRTVLADQLATRPNVTLDWGVELTAIAATRDRVDVTTADGAVIEGDVLIAADGSASTVRSLVGLPVFDVPYGQRAVVTHVATARPHAQTAWQRFLPSGPVALLPLTDGRSSVVWSTADEQAESLLASDEETFAVSLADATDRALGDIVDVGPRASFPLRALHARRYCATRIALIGDAAHTIHPLAGQGMNLGLFDAAVLADVLEEAGRGHEDPGDLRTLRRYERRQKGRNLKTLLAMDALHRLFAKAGPLLAPVRASGMSLIDASPVAKRRLMREALGVTGELPSAARVKLD